MFILCTGKGIKSTSCVPVVVRRPSCGAITVSSKFQDLGEPDPLEAEAAFVSKVVTRAARLLTILLKS